jgi:hypothetical protein
MSRARSRAEVRLRGCATGEAVAANTGCVDGSLLLLSSAASAGEVAATHHHQMIQRCG